MAEDKTDKEIHDWINDHIISKCQDGDYIFRGESKKYTLPHVPLSSGLYRQYGEIIHRPIVEIEQYIVKESGRHVSGGEDNVLTELQHFGGKTALVDFTRDVYIALFFACYDNQDDNGVLYLFTKEEIGKDILIEPTGKSTRVTFQSSVFVRPHLGYLDASNKNYKVIPKKIKQDILKYISKFHNVKFETVYNDIHGVIKSWNDEPKQNYIKYLHSAERAEYQTDNPEQKEMFDNGRKAADEGHYKISIDYFNKVIKLNTKSPGAYNNRGNAQISLGNYKKAIKDYNKVIKLCPEDARAYYNRGLVQYLNGDYEKAIGDYDEAMRLNSQPTTPPMHVDIYINRGVAKSDMEYYKEGIKDFKEAIKDFKKVIKLAPQHVYGYINIGLTKARTGEFIGLTKARMGEFKKAIWYYNKAIRLNPKYALGYYNRGCSRYFIKEYRKAIEDYNNALKLWRDTALLKRSKIYRGLENAKKAGGIEGAEEDRKKAEELEKAEELQKKQKK